MRKEPSKRKFLSYVDRDAPDKLTWVINDAIQVGSRNRALPISTSHVGSEHSDQKVQISSIVSDLTLCRGTFWFRRVPHISL
jgi:hypothetical protein